MAKYLKIFILIIVICFLPTKIFGFFATPDNHIYSMPFGVQSSSPGVRPLTSGGSNLDTMQAETSQNSITADSSDLSSQNNSNLNNKESPKKISLAAFIVWPLIILVFIAVFVFLKRKLEE
jgi:ATP-dependent Zn protease